MAAPLILALETASLTGSIALARGGDLLCAHDLSGDRRHTPELLTRIRDSLTAHGLTLRDVDVVAYSTGPGSFTGLRIAATIATMAQSVAGCRVVAVSTLAAIARNALDATEPGTHVAPLLDAKRDQVYAALYRVEAGPLLTERQPPAIHDPAAWLADAPRPLVALGEGLRHHADAVTAAGVDLLDELLWQPRATAVLAEARPMIRRGQFAAPAEITPLYLRPPECEEVYEKRRAAARHKRGE